MTNIMHDDDTCTIKIRLVTVNNYHPVVLGANWKLQINTNMTWHVWYGVTDILEFQGINWDALSNLLSH